MDLPHKKKQYVQKYRETWEAESEFKGWLKPVLGDTSKARCQICVTEFYAKLSDIRKHSKTNKHKQKLDFKKTQALLPVKIVPKTTVRVSSRAEGVISLFIAEHCSILAVDHLGVLCKKVFSSDEGAKNMQLHRTKCTNIITEVLAPYFTQSLVEDIGDQKYSVLIDESTDVSVSKTLGIVIRYYSVKNQAIRSAFLKLALVEIADARHLAAVLVNSLKNLKIPIANMVGIGTDNASVMVGVNNGLVEQLKREHGLKHLILIRCVCHSLQLAVSHASVNTLPRNIEFLVRETYNWFSISPKRQEEYKKVYETINCGKQPLKILKVCATRWLSIEPAVCRILEQWEELKLHFSFAMGNDNCYTADLLYKMYCDDSNQLYMLYLKHTLKDVQIALKAFEGEDNDPTKLLDTLVFLMQSLGKNIIFPTVDLLTTPVPNECMYANPYLSYTFEQKMSESSLSEENKSAIKKRCIQFSLKLIKEIQQRLPSNITILKKMSMLSVDETLKVNKNNSIADVAKELGFSNECIDGMLQEWHNINFIKWENTTNTVQFWSEVFQFKNGARENPFSLISRLAITILSLPHSNAEVERVFSAMNIIKTKQRNRLSLKTLNALILIRDQLKKQNKDCASFEIPSEVLQLIGTNNSYSFATKNIEQEHQLLSSAVDVDVQPSTSTSALSDDHETEELFDLLSDDDE